MGISPHPHIAGAAHESNPGAQQRSRARRGRGTTSTQSAHAQWFCTRKWVVKALPGPSRGVGGSGRASVNQRQWSVQDSKHAGKPTAEPTSTHGPQVPLAPQYVAKRKCGWQGESTPEHTGATLAGSCGWTVRGRERGGVQLLGSPQSSVGSSVGPRRPSRPTKPRHNPILTPSLRTLYTRAGRGRASIMCHNPVPVAPLLPKIRRLRIHRTNWAGRGPPPPTTTQLGPRHRTVHSEGRVTARVKQGRQGACHPAPVQTRGDPFALTSTHRKAGLRGWSGGTRPKPHAAPLQPIKSPLQSPMEGERAPNAPVQAPTGPVNIFVWPPHTAAKGALD